jgi:hypothetical protein
VISDHGLVSPRPQRVDPAGHVDGGFAAFAIRDAFKGQTLADLYGPLAMPKALRDAHKELDRAVDKCYRATPITSERPRVEYLFDLYQKLVTPLTAPSKLKRASRSGPKGRTS